MLAYISLNGPLQKTDRAGLYNRLNSPLQRTYRAGLQQPKRSPAEDISHRLTTGSTHGPLQRTY